MTAEKQPITTHNSTRASMLVNELIQEIALDVHDHSPKGSEYVNLLNSTLTVIASMILRTLAPVELSMFTDKPQQEKELFLMQVVLQNLERVRVDYHIELEDLFKILVQNVHVGEQALIKELKYSQEEIDLIKKAAIMELSNAEENKK